MTARCEVRGAGRNARPAWGSVSWGAAGEQEGAGGEVSSALWAAVAGQNAFFHGEGGISQNEHCVYGLPSSGILSRVRAPRHES